MPEEQHLDEMILYEYLDGELAAGALADVEAHLLACPACAARLGELRALFLALEVLPDLRLERDLSKGVLARLGAPHQQRPAPSKFPRALWWALAGQWAVALALFGIMAWLAWPWLALQIERAQAGLLQAVKHAYQAGGLRLDAWLAGWQVAQVQALEAWHALPGPGEWLSALQLPDWDLQVWAAGGRAMQVSTLEAVLLAAASSLWVVGNGLLLPGRRAIGRCLNSILKQRSR